MKIPAKVLDHCRFWEAIHGVSLQELAVIEERITVAMVTEFGLDISALALRKPETRNAFRADVRSRRRTPRAK